MTKPNTSLTEATKDLAAWRLRAMSGVNAVSNMRQAVEKMNAVAKVNAIINGRSGK